MRLILSSLLSRAYPPPRFQSSLISRQFASGATPPDTANTASYHTFHPNGSQRHPPSFPLHFTTGVDPQQQLLPEPSSSLEVTTNYIPDLVLPPSVGSSQSSYALTNTLASDPPSLPLTAPSGLGLPVYPASGFDVLSILSRVVNRPSSLVPWICCAHSLLWM